jgi:YggT family protein
MSNLVWWLINAYIWVVIIKYIISWFNPNPHTPLMSYLNRVVDPAITMTRKICPLTLGGLDCSPIILLVFLHFLADFLKNALTHLGLGLSFTSITPIFIFCLLSVVISLAWFIFMLMIARVVMSMVDPSPYNPVVMMVYALTEPLLAPLRGMFSSRGPAKMDVRAVVAALAIFLVTKFVLINLQGAIKLWYISSAVGL